MKYFIVQDRIESKIYLIRGKKVMIDRDLASLYRVETRALNQAVRRNGKRFPIDFMFQLSKDETKYWKSQIVISKKEKMGLRKRPLAFTEHGILMLSSVLNSERAIQANIVIMRTFVKLRKIFSHKKQFGQRLKELERKVGQHDHHIHAIFEAIRNLMEPPQTGKGKIGFYV